MFMYQFRRAVLPCLLLALSFFSGCGGGSSSSTPPPASAATLSSISIGSSSSAAMNVGDTRQLTATGKYSDGSSKDITSTASWTTSSASVATVSAGLVSAAGVGNATITATMSGIQGATAITVAASVTSISISPGSPTLTVGATLQLAGTANYNDGTHKNITASTTWSSSSNAVATVSSSGLVTAVAAGTATIQGVYNSQTATATITVKGATVTLTGFVVAPSSASIGVGNTSQLIATGTYSDASTADLTAQATWTSSATTVATVSAGLVTGVKGGVATVTASYGGFNSASAITVTASATGVSLVPSAPVLTIGATVQMSAIATYNDGTTRNVTASTTFDTSNASVATTTATGLVTGVAAGNANIAGTFSGFTGSASVTVKASSVTLTGLAVSPATASIVAGKTTSFKATGAYSDGSTADLTTQATWTTSNAVVATVSAGLVLGKSAGSAVITANIGAVTGTATVTVTPKVTSVTLTPTTPTLTVGATVQLTAVAKYSDGSTKNVTASTTWVSSSSAVATVSAAGLVKGVSGGTATITGTFSGVKGTASVNVKDAAVTLTGIAVSPASRTMAVGSNFQLAAIATYSDSSTSDVTTQAAWSSSNTAVATVSAGLVSAKASGNTTITASMSGVNGTGTITVAASVTKVDISPSAPTITVGATLQLASFATYSDGSSNDVTSLSTWTTSDSSVATVTSMGVVTGVAGGAATITGKFSGVSGTAVVTVKSAGVTVISLALTPANATVSVGKTLQMASTATYSDKSTADVTLQSTWSTSDAALATVSSTGLVSGVALGGLSVSASLDGVTGSTALEVRPALTSLAVLPSNPVLDISSTQQFSVQGLFSDGSEQDLTSQASWSSDTPSVATIDQKGLATAVSPGTSLITASVSGTNGSTTLTVSPATLTAIIIDQDGETVPSSVPLQLTATGEYSDGNTAALTGVTFTSSDPTILSIDATGIATPLSAGSVTVTGTLGAVSGTGILTVSPAALVSVAVTPKTVTTPLGLAQQFTATGTFSDASVAQLTTGVVWSSSDEAVATVDQTGLAIPLTVGSTNITATISSLSDSGALTVTNATLLSVAVTPSSFTMPRTVTKQFTATGSYSDSTTQDLTNTATWVSADAAVATISQSGVALGVSVGATTITASSGGSSDSAALTIDNATLVSIAITPLADIVNKGTRVQYKAIATFSDGSTSNITSMASWKSSKPRIAHISGSGLARAHKAGTTTIKCTFNGVQASTTLTVQ